MLPQSRPRAVTRRPEPCGDIMKQILLRLAVSAALFCGLGSQAEGITYTFDATGSGTLGGVAFTNAAFTITVTADTMAIVNCGGGVFSVDSATADIAISGFATASILTPTRLFDNNSVSVLGLSQASCLGGDYLDISNSAFGTYNLATALGPIFDPNPFAVGQFHDVSTTGGNSERHQRSGCHLQRVPQLRRRAGS